MTTPRGLTFLLLAGGFGLAGCQFGHLVGGMAQNYEYSKLIEVHPEYDGLEDKTVAVVVDADLATLYEYPDAAITVATNVSHRIQRSVPGALVLSPQIISDWQYRTPQWGALPFSDIASGLDVDRVVHIDLFEFRLNPPGNRWLWEGVCAGNVGIIERDGLDPDNFVETFRIAVNFPKEQGVGRDNADAAVIKSGLLTLFVEETAWLFYRHYEAKYPDKYNGPSPESVLQEERAKERAKEQAG